MTKLRALIRRAGTSQREIAARLGVTDGYVSSLLSGRFDLPERRALDLCRALRCSRRALAAVIVGRKRTRVRSGTKRARAGLATRANKSRRAA